MFGTRLKELRKKNGYTQVTLAEKLGLIVTGGSDFHGPNPNNGNIILGKNFVPEWVYEQLIQEKKRLDISKN